MSALDDVKKLMVGYDFTGASALLEKLLADEPDNDDAWALYGLCRRLQGDEATFLAIGEKLRERKRGPRGRCSSRYRQLYVAACSAAMLMAAGMAPGEVPSAPVYGGPALDPGDVYCVYAGPPIEPPVVVPVPIPALKAVKPKASDGRHTTGVAVTWKKVKNASGYIVMRARKRDYDVAEQIAATTELEYFDEEAACYPKEKFYYWVVPVNDTGYAFPAPKKSDVGYSKRQFTINAETDTLRIGESIALAVAGGPCDEVSPADCKWKVSSKTKGMVSETGVFTARKKGKVTVTATYKGVKSKFVFIVLPE